MNKQKLLTIFFVSLGMMVWAQPKKAPPIFKKTSSGLEYKLFPHGGTVKPVPGDVVKAIIVYTNAKDSVIYDSRKSRPDNIFELLAPTFKGGLEEGMMMMSIGDSAVFRVSADSVFLKTFQKPLPPYLKKGSKLIFKVKLQAVQPKETIDHRTPEEIQKDNEKRKETEPKLIEEFISLNNITAAPTPSGLYYIEREVGKGNAVTSKSIVKIIYSCTTLDGTAIDTQSNPIEIDMSLGKITKGMEEGLLLMSEGTKATLIIPSVLAFGSRKINKIQPYTTLIYDLEVVEVK